MVPYFGHTWHTIKAPHKPIKQDYKVWALGNLGYIFNWLWYSETLGTEDLGMRSRRNTMADTQTLVISLAKSLRIQLKVIPYTLIIFLPTAPGALGRLNLPFSFKRQPF